MAPTRSGRLPGSLHRARSATWSTVFNQSHVPGMGWKLRLTTGDTYPSDSE